MQDMWMTSLPYTTRSASLKHTWKNNSIKSIKILNFSNSRTKYNLHSLI